MKRMYKLKFIIAAFVLAATCTKAQPPNLHDGITYLSEYVINYKYGGHTVENHLAVVDSLYIESINYFEGDISEALLALTFTSIPFKSIPVKVPLINTKLDMTLSHVSDSLFAKRKYNTPSKLFFDSPDSKLGDSDKLAHFFGNAFLSYNISFFNLSKFMGIFVEIFEQTYTTEGVYSFKDIQINHFGELFGQALNENKNLLPSDVLKYYSILFIKL